jgi:hypothetical protein
MTTSHLESLSSIIILIETKYPLIKVIFSEYFDFRDITAHYGHGSLCSVFTFITKRQFKQ